MVFRCLVLPLLLLLLLSCLHLTRSFVPLGTTRCDVVAITSSSSRLFMGLYDKPLPPRPSPREDDNNNNNNDDDDDENQPFPIQERLFEFDMNGKEKRDLLPRLRRRLDSGIECYFEEQDRVVQNLVEKTDCHPQDAAWALEACAGDITEAWTCISTARRTLLNSNEDSFPSLQEQFEARLKRDQATKDRKKWGTWAPGVVDEQWLPTKNPNPVDDEPWFTG